MDETEVQSTLERLQTFRNDLRRFRKPFPKRMHYQLSDLYDKAYGIIRNVYIDESEALLKLRTTAKTATEEILVLSKTAVNSDSKKYKRILVSILNNYINGLQKMLSETITLMLVIGNDIR